MAMNLFSASGERISLTNEIGRGGEGSVYDVAHDPNLVAKIYHRPVDGEKLSCMPKLASADLLRVAAWPVDTLHEVMGGRPKGLLMPKIMGYREIHQLFSPKQRPVHFPNSDWSFLVHVAMNCAAAFETVHDSGHVIGDVNERGVMTSGQGTVRLIDCDSFQIRNGTRVFRCTVGVPAYTPPELQGADLRSSVRTRDHDCFGLGVLIFQLLFLGRHPFVGRYSGPGEMPIDRAILERRFSFSRSAASFQMSAPPHSIDLESISPRAAELFERAFTATGSARPSARDWRISMEKLKGSLTRCAVEQAHWYITGIQDCPWCRLEEGGGPSFFTSAVDAFEFDSHFDLAAVWQQVIGVRATPSSDFKLPAPPIRIVPKPIPEDADLEAVGSLAAVPPPPQICMAPLPDLPLYAPELHEDKPPFEDEPEPTAPVFVPDSVPADPPYIPLPEPAVPEWRAVEYLENVKLNRRRACSSPDYKLAKWGTLSSALVLSMLLLPVSHFLWPAAAVVAMMFLALSVNWILLWRPVRKQYSGEVVAAIARKTHDLQRHLATVAAVGAERERVRIANEGTRQQWAATVVELERLRNELPERNAQRRIKWEAECDHVRRRQAEIRERNARRRAEWRGYVQGHEKRRLAEWAEAVKAVKTQRERVEYENLKARNEWDVAMRGYALQRTTIDRHNATVRATRKRWDAERARRQKQLEQCRSDLQAILDQWSKESRDFRRQSEQTNARLGDVRHSYEQLKAEFEHCRDQLCRDGREVQLEQYLQSMLIEDADIAGIGKGRKDTLRFQGIETALDVTELTLMRVRGKGFGEKLGRILLTWRFSVESAFRFDPQKVILPPALRGLRAKFQTRKLALQRQLRAGPEELLSIAQNAEIRRDLLRGLSLRAVEQHARAEADLRIMSSP